MHKIQTEFTANMLIEVQVLDRMGDPIDVFNGLSSSLSGTHFAPILTEPGCFYVLSIVGIDRALADSVELIPENIIRREFFWLTGLCYVVMAI